MSGAETAPETPVESKPTTDAPADPTDTAATSAPDNAKPEQSKAEGKAEAAESKASTDDDKATETAPAAPAGPKKSVLEMKEVQLLLHQLSHNVALQAVLAIPLVLLSSYLLGWFLVWGGISVVYILYCCRMVTERKLQLYDTFINDTVDRTRDHEYCEWLNMFVRKYWVSCVGRHVEPHIDQLQAILEKNKPPFLHALSVGNWSVGVRPPRVDCIYPHTKLSDDHVQMDFDIHWVSDFFLELCITLPTRQSVPIRAGDVEFRGRMRLDFQLNDLFPQASIVSISFVDEPLIDFGVKPLGAVDMVSLPGIYEWLQAMIQESIRPLMVWPQEIQFTMGGGAVTEDLDCTLPLIDVGIVHADERKVPPNWSVVSRTSGGIIPANLNRKSAGKDVFLCYRRMPKNDADREALGDIKPITDLCVFYPDLRDQPPPGFQVIERTINKGDGNLNTTTKGQRVLLAYRRGTKAPPITHVGVVNKTEGDQALLGFSTIELTPSGREANTNMDNDGDQIQIAYKGGCQSLLGHATEMRQSGGLLRVRIIKAHKLKAADVGGTSDPYCEVALVDPAGKDIDKQKTKVKDKTVAPRWDESFMFHYCTGSSLKITVFDKDLVGKDDVLGAIKLRLDNVACGYEVTSWYTLQLINKGEIRVGVAAVDFGKPTMPDADRKPLEQIEIGKSKHSGLPNPPDSEELEVTHIHSVIRQLSNSGAPANDQAVEKWGNAGRKAAGVANVLSTYQDGKYVSHDGNLEKKAGGFSVGGVGGGHSKRYFRLHQDSLDYYKSHKDHMAGKNPETFSLAGAEITAEDGDALSFTLKKGKNKLSLRASNADEQAGWVSAIKHNIGVSVKHSSS